MTLIWLTLLAMSVLSIAEAVAIVALAREVGLMGRRLPPAPALESVEGPGVGNAFPVLKLRDLRTGTPYHLGETFSRATVVFFLSTRCVTCDEVLREMGEAVRDWPSIDILPVMLGEEAEAIATLERTRFPHRVLIGDAAAQSAANIQTTPRTVVVDQDGKVVAQGIVNNREMLSSLIQGNIRRSEGLIWSGGWREGELEQSN